MSPVSRLEVSVTCAQLLPRGWSKSFPLTAQNVPCRLSIHKRLLLLAFAPGPSRKQAEGASLGRRDSAEGACTEERCQTNGPCPLVRGPTCCVTGVALAPRTLLQWRPTPEASKAPTLVSKQHTPTRATHVLITKLFNRPYHPIPSSRVEAHTPHDALH